MKMEMIISDDVQYLDPNIGVVSYGATRIFRIKGKI
jgi:hypothetical protein